MEKITVDIWGSCVSRDALYIGGNDQGYEVKNFIQDCLFSIQFDKNPISEIVPDNIAADIPNFNKKCICNDINKSVPSLLKTSGSEWLIIDGRVCSYGVISHIHDNKKHYLTNRHTEIKKSLLFKNNDEWIVNVKLDDDLVSAEDQFFNFIKERYGNNIILLETVESTYVLNKNGVLEYNDYRDRSRIAEYEFTLRALNRLHCWYVKCPYNVIADSYHKWSFDPVHYIFEYYKYAYDAIFEITHNSDNSVVCGKLDLLYADITCKISKIRSGEISSISNTAGRIKDAMTNNNEILARNLLIDLLIENNDGAYPFISELLFETKISPGSIEGERWLKIIAESDVKTQNDIIKKMIKINDSKIIEQLIPIIEDLINKNQNDNYVVLARAYRYGHGVPVNLELARKWLELALKNGQTWAFSDYFDTLWSIDTDESIHTMIAEARIHARTNADALGRLARAYVYGKGVTKNYEFARKLYCSAKIKGAQWIDEDLEKLDKLVNQIQD